MAKTFLFSSVHRFGGAATPPAGQNITGSAGIASAEAFGSDGIIAGPVGVSGTDSGIASAEAFGSDGSLSVVLVGSAGIASAEAFGSGGIVAGPVGSSDSGIASAEAFGADGTLELFIEGSAGISSAEDFGSDGELDLTIVSSTGIVSAEAFGSGGTLILDLVLEGSTGIASGEAFGSGGDVAGAIVGDTGIASEEAFGVGVVSNVTLTGSAGITSGEAFGADGTVGSIGGPLTGNTGIVSAEAFGVGIVAGPVGDSGVDTGIASAEAFGSGGALVSKIVGSAGIPSDEAFGSTGFLAFGVAGIFGIPSAEEFGTSGAILLEATGTSSFRTFIGNPALDRSDKIKVGTIRLDRQLNFSAAGSFDIWDEDGAFFPDIGSPVYLFYWTGVSWKKYFGGTIDSWELQKPRAKASETGYNLFSVRIVDWGKSLSRRVLSKKYSSATFGTLTSILEDLSLIFSAEGIKIVIPTDPGITLPDVEFVDTPWNQVLDKLGDLTNLNWQVDWDKNCFLYDRPSLIQYAPVDVNDHDENISNIVVRRSRGLYRNVEILKATASILKNSVTVTETYTAFTVLNTTSGDPYNLIVGNSQLYDSRYLGNVVSVTDIKIKRVGDPDFTSLLFKEFGPYDGTDYFYGQVTPNSIDFAWDIFRHAAVEPAAGDLIKVIFQLDASTSIGGPTTYSNDTEIAARQAIEGGSGRYEDVYDATAVATQAALDTLGASLLSRFSRMGLEVDYLIDNQADLECGQQQVVDLPKYGINNEDLLVESISSWEEAKTQFHHNVKVSNSVQQQDALTAFARLIKRLTAKPLNNQKRVYTWPLAETIPGITNPGLTVQNSIGTELIITDKNGFVCESFTVRFKTAPTGQAVHIRIKANGTTIFSGTGYVVYPAGATSTQVFFSFRDAPLLLATGSVLTLDIVQIGTTTPGKDGVAHLVGLV